MKLFIKIVKVNFIEKLLAKDWKIDSNLTNSIRKNKINFVKTLKNIIIAKVSNIIFKNKQISNKKTETYEKLSQYYWLTLENIGEPRSNFSYFIGLNN